jgi:ketosteroid isomerase-like protein
MSQENVEIVREVMGLLSGAESGRLTPALFERFATDVRIDMSRRVFDPNVYEGHAGLRRLAAEDRDAWAEFPIEEAERFVDAGDRVIVIETRGGRGSGSGVEVDLRLAVIWTLRKGKVVRIETYIDAQEALESAGIDEQEM